MTKQRVLQALGTIEGVEHLAADQTILYFENGEVFHSYDSFIVVRYYENPTVYLGGLWNCGRTTSKYRNKFLRKTSKELNNMVKEGTAIVLKDL
jgi:hypothetical protein